MTDHCVLMLPLHKYCAPFVARINEYLAGQFTRRLHVVSTDGDCAFHTVSFFSGIPVGVLRWMTAVATAIRVTAAAHMPPQADAAQKVRALLSYYADELAKQRREQAAKAAAAATKPRQADVAAAAAGVAAVRDEAVASAAVRLILKPKEWVESSVVALACDVLQLRMALLTVADEQDSARWHVMPLFDTRADSSVVDESVRLAVFFAQHYSPCILQAAVHAALVPACRSLPDLVEALCVEVVQLPLATWPQLIAGSADVKVRVLFVAV